MKIYTRTGDEGTTSLFSGQRVAKNNLFIEALGTLDEANTTIGLSLSFLPQDAVFHKTRRELNLIQHALFDVGAAVATPRSCEKDIKLQKTSFDEDAVKLLENWIDEMDAQLPVLKEFILPGGHSASAAIHLARTTIRRAERFIIPLYLQGDVAHAVVKYLNRLSDYLFTTSRLINYHLQIEETHWQPHKEFNNA